MKIKIFVNDIEAIAELKNTPTTNAIYDALPLDGAANRWGDEIYFVIPLRIDIEDNATEVVEEGDIAYWPEGCCFCIFFGKTPNSTEDEIIKAIRKGRNTLVTKYAPLSTLMRYSVTKLQVSYNHTTNYINHNYFLPKRIVAKKMLSLVNHSPGKIDHLFKVFTYLTFGGAFIASAARNALD